MSTLTLLLLLLTLQATAVYCQGHTHDQYASEQDVNELRSEFNSKMEAVESEWETKQESLENEKSFWQRALLSVVKMLHSVTSGSAIWQYWEQQKEAFQEVEDTIDDLKNYIDIGTPQNPASSCKALRPNSTNGLYWIKDGIGNTSQQYCDMEREGCGTRGGWMRIAHLDMTQPGQQCPTGFRTITTPKRLCGRPGFFRCVSVTFPTHSIPYNKVCGKVIGYQDKTTDAQCPYYQGIRTLEDSYIDGVSITHGSNPRKHVWTFMAGHGENTIYTWCAGCPCFINYTGIRVPFIGEHYFCDTASETNGIHIFYANDPLWDGQGCGSRNKCCKFNNPPWFCRELNATTSDNIELRLCGNENIYNEDAPLEHIELYVQ